MKKSLLAILLYAAMLPMASASEVKELAGYLTLGMLGMLGVQGDHYVALDYGNANYAHAVGSDGVSTFNHGGMWRAAVGNRLIGKPEDLVRLGVEFSFSTLGNSSIDYGAQGKDTLHGSSLQMALIMAYPLTPSFDLTGKLGFVNTKTNYSTSVAGRQGGAGSNSDILWGAGVQYHLDERNMLRVQYDNLGRLDRSANPMTASVLSAGLVYGF